MKRSYLITGLVSFLFITVAYLAYFFLAGSWLSEYSTGMGYDGLASVLFALTLSFLIVFVLMVAAEKGRTRLGWIGFALVFATFIFFVPVVPTSISVEPMSVVNCSSNPAGCASIPPNYCNDSAFFPQNERYYVPQNPIYELGSLGYFFAGHGLAYKVYPLTGDVDGFLIQSGNTVVLETFQPPSDLCH